MAAWLSRTWRRRAGQRRGRALGGAGLEVGFAQHLAQRFVADPGPLAQFKQGAPCGVEVVLLFPGLLRGGAATRSSSSSSAGRPSGPAATPPSSPFRVALGVRRTARRTSAPVADAKGSRAACPSSLPLIAPQHRAAVRLGGRCHARPNRAPPGGVSPPLGTLDEEERAMASGSQAEKAGAEALDYVKTEREAEAAVRAKEAGKASGDAPVPPPSGDSPKPHGDKLEHAARGAAGTPSKGDG
jgi:hypothetical protein